MICKWCGSKVMPGEPQCRNCGREVPPISDCGGFYDLTNGLKTSTVPSRPETRVDLTPIQEEIKRGVSIQGKWLNSLRLTMILLFVLVIILQIVLLIQVGSLNGQIQELKELHSTAEAEPVEDPVSTEPSAEATEEAASDPEDTAEQQEMTNGLPNVSISCHGNKVEAIIREEENDQSGVREIQITGDGTDFTGVLILEIRTDEEKTVLNARHEAADESDLDKTEEIWSWDYWCVEEERWISLTGEDGAPLTGACIELSSARKAELVNVDLKLRCTLTKTDDNGNITVEIADIYI